MKNLPKNKTKLVCTIGPASDSPEMIEKMIEAGMNVARLNFSPGDFTSHGVVIQKFRAASILSPFSARLLFSARQGADQGFVRLYTGERFSYIFFNLREIKRAFFIGKADGCSGCSSSPCSPNPVDIVFRLIWKVIVYNMTDIFNMQSTGGHISCNKNINPAVFKTVQNSKPLVLGNIP